MWTAEDEVNRSAVVVKVPKADPAGAEPARTPEGRSARRELARRFERELRILERLRHPRIPRLLHHGYRSGERYIVMEHVGGKSLRDFLDTHRPLPVGAAVAIAVSVGETLAYAHRQGVIHRDLKPPNIVLREDGVAFLIDFGIAFPMDPNATRYTAQGMTPGSVGYTAPELMGNSTITPTTAADLYSYGCIAHELLAGTEVFTEKPGCSRYWQHLNSPPPRVRDIRPSIPEDIDRLLWRLLAKEPGPRPALSEVVAALGPLLPRAGDPAPSPELCPDPTAPHRLCDGLAMPEALPAVPRPRDSRRRSHRRTYWPQSDGFGRLVDAADREILDESPGGAVEQLVVELPYARGAWGISDLMVARAQMVCADGLRIEGSTGEAAVLYRGLVEALSTRQSPEDRGLVLEAQVGLAECLIATDTLTEAVEAWEYVVRKVVGTRPLPERVVRRCRQVALELRELGCGDDIAGVAAMLPDT